ncbi:MAG: hypothetical protein K0S00_3491 [Xanthobacteraceae bacterium]|nr:hypothetical protein [Xanthobacteraceae bacterium]
MVSIAFLKSAFLAEISPQSWLVAFRQASITSVG